MMFVLSLLIIMLLYDYNESCENLDSLSALQIRGYPVLLNCTHVYDQAIQWYHVPGNVTLPLDVFQTSGSVLKCLVNKDNCTTYKATSDGVYVCAGNVAEPCNGYNVTFTADDFILDEVESISSTTSGEESNKYTERFSVSTFEALWYNTSISDTDTTKQLTQSRCECRCSTEAEEWLSMLLYCTTGGLVMVVTTSVLGLLYTCKRMKQLQRAQSLALQPEQKNFIYNNCNSQDVAHVHVYDEIDTEITGFICMACRHGGVQSSNTSLDFVKMSRSNVYLDLINEDEYIEKKSESGSYLEPISIIDKPHSSLEVAEISMKIM